MSFNERPLRENPPNDGDKITQDLELGDAKDVLLNVCSMTFDLFVTVDFFCLNFMLNFFFNFWRFQSFLQTQKNETKIRFF